jgi:hypothetical protein
MMGNVRLKCVFFSLVRNELNAQLENYEHKWSSSAKLVDEYKRENAKIVCRLLEGIHSI